MCIRDVWWGWSISRKLDSGFAQEALESALKERQPAAGLIHHSDRGVQYACGDYVKQLEASGITMSMSRPGNPYDNAWGREFYENAESGRSRWGGAIAISKTPPHRLEPLLKMSITCNASTRPWTIVHRWSSKPKAPSQRKKKEAKKKESSGPWKLPELWKNKERFFHKLLESGETSVHSYHRPDDD
jgi:integrase-like protein